MKSDPLARRPWPLRGARRLSRALLLIAALALGLALYGALPLSGIARAEGEVDAGQLVRSADRARGAEVSPGLSWTVNITSVEGEKTQTQTYAVKTRGDDALIECTEPEKRRGEVILARGPDLWFSKPSLRTPVSISPKQRLSGKAANGDIASTLFSRDYDAKLVGREDIGGRPAYRLELTAKSKSVPYQTIRYWVDAERQVGLKAEFLTGPDKVFKTAEYEHGNQLTVDAQARPFISKMTIRDPAFPANVTTFEYSDVRVEDHPEGLFELSRLTRSGGP